MSTLPSDPRDIAFGVPPIPDWVEGFREHQVGAIEQTLDALERGVRFVLLEAPTGSGKTLMAEAIRRLRAKRAVYVCTTKSLQDQFLADFPYAKVLKGRANYPTLDKPEQFKDRFAPLTCGECVARMVSLPACSGCDDDIDTEERRVMHCVNCHPYHSCPYQVARRAAIGAPIAVTNTAYLMTGALTPAPGDDAHALIVVDECDTLESLLMNQVEVVISEKRRKALGLRHPAKKTVETAWMEWAVYATPIISRAAIAAATEAEHHPTPDLTKEARSLASLAERMLKLVADLSDPDGANGWVYDSGQADRNGSVVFKPVRVHDVGQDILWRQAKQWVLMSATIIDPVEYTSSLGIEPGTWELVKVPNTFPKENRPIHVLSGPDMGRRAMEDSGGKNLIQCGELVAKVLRKHPEERVLVHTVSYKLANDLFDQLRHEFRDRLIIYGASSDREAALNAYKEMPGAVALAPSFDRGVDLPGDLCRVQVIAKVPFPNLGDKQVARRLYTRGGDLWFRVQTVRTIVQMTGRGVRSSTDTCSTYIIDSQFVTNIWNKSRILLPPWWKEAVDMRQGVLL